MIVYKASNISKRFGSLCVLEDISLQVNRQEVVAILGPSGCGKTTLLRILAGMLIPDTGSLSGFDKARISYLFQEPRLLKWKTIAGNLQFVLKSQYDPEERNRIIEHYLKLVELWKYRHYYPRELSGGMQQRVAIARAFAFPSEILLMDEPFKSLDLSLKLRLINDFSRLWSQDMRTVIFVTHDIQAALLLADSIYMLSEKPTLVRKVITNPTPRSERNLKNTSIRLLEEELYELFSEWASREAGHEGYCQR